MWWVKHNQLKGLVWKIQFSEIAYNVRLYFKVTSVAQNIFKFTVIHEQSIFMFTVKPKHPASTTDIKNFFHNSYHLSEVLSFEMQILISLLNTTSTAETENPFSLNVPLLLYSMKTFPINSLTMPLLESWSI